jgi:hypothetical protein
MDLKGRRVIIRPQEMESLLNLKSMLDHQEALASYGEKYQKLGWLLKTGTPREMADLEIDFSTPQETWDSQFWEQNLGRPKMNFLVCTGKQSGIMVLEVVRGAGDAILDRYRPWRAGCIAVLGGLRELHFYAWDRFSHFDSASGDAPYGITWYGEGQAVLLPPSVDPETHGSWRWLSPPWESPLQSPSRSLLEFFRDHLKSPTPVPDQSSAAPPSESISWELFLENAFSSAGKGTPGMRMGAPDTALQSGFFKRRSSESVQPEAALRRPFSCTQRKV